MISTADPQSSMESTSHPMHDDVSGFAGVHRQQVSFHVYPDSWPGCGRPRAIICF